MATLNADSGCRPERGSDSRTREVSRDAVLSEADIRRIVDRRLGAGAFAVSRWSLDRVGENNGFLGQYFRLTVVVSSAEACGGCDAAAKPLRVLRFFAKTPPVRGSPQFEFLMRYDTFDKEIAVYAEVFPSIGEGHGPCGKWAPRFYLAKSNEIIVLEDACEAGYATPDKYVPFDWDRLALAVRALSTLHSRSLLLDEKLRASGRCLLDLYGHLLDEVIFHEEEQMSRRALDSGIKGACACVDLADTLAEPDKASARNRLRSWGPALPRLLRPARNFRNLICHRDIWANNLMFKHDPSGKPIACYVVDYQFLRYCPPAMDFVFFLYLATDRANRESHYEALQRLYHDTMRAELAAEALDVERCLPWSEFLESCRETRKTALVYAIVNVQIQLISEQAAQRYFHSVPDDLEEVLYGDKRGDLVVGECLACPEYRRRHVEIVEEIAASLPDHPPDP